MASNKSNVGSGSGDVVVSGSGSGSVSFSIPNENAGLLWNYVTKLDKRGEVGGTWNFKCNFCGESRNGSYSKVKAHLLQVKGQGIAICKKVARQDRIEMTRAEEEFERKKKESGAKDVPLPCQSQSELDSSSKK